MEKKQLLDKDGNPITKERIEEVFREQFKDDVPFMKRHEWEEDGQICHSWRIHTPSGKKGRAIDVFTNDAGAELINEAMKKWVNENYGKSNKDNE